MASVQRFEKWAVDNPPLCSKPTTSQTKQVFLPIPISRRSLVLISVLSLDLISPPQPLLARERRNRKVIPLEDYLTSSDGLKYFDVAEGKGPVAEKGSTILVHFDCVYRGITAVSSRESKLLAGNRSIAQRTVIVPPEAGYGKKGMNEIPAGATFDLNIELLQIMPSEGK